jgi:hypothetical protein
MYQRQLTVAPKKVHEERGVCVGRSGANLLPSDCLLLCLTITFGSRVLGSHDKLGNQIGLWYWMYDKECLGPFDQGLFSLLC